MFTFDMSDAFVQFFDSVFVFPLNLFDSDSDAHVRDCIRSYTEDWAVFNRKYDDQRVTSSSASLDVCFLDAFFW